MAQRPGVTLGFIPVRSMAAHRDAAARVCAVPFESSDQRSFELRAGKRNLAYLPRDDPEIAPLTARVSRYIV